MIRSLIKGSGGARWAIGALGGLLVLQGCANNHYAFGMSSHWRCESGLELTPILPEEPEGGFEEPPEPIGYITKCGGEYVEHVGGAMSDAPGRLITSLGGAVGTAVRTILGGVAP